MLQLFLNRTAYAPFLRSLCHVHFEAHSELSKPTPNRSPRETRSDVLFGAENSTNSLTTRSASVKEAANGLQAVSLGPATSFQ